MPNSHQQKRSAAVAAAAAAALLLLTACGDEAPPQQKAPRVLAAKVEARDYQERIEASGELKARDSAAVAAELAGVVTALQVEAGDAVQQNQTLLELDPEHRQLELNKARARHQEAKAAQAEAQREHKRMQKLHAQGIAAAAALDAAATKEARAEAHAQSALAELGVAQRARRKASVRAPFQGFVARRLVSRGEYVQPGQALFEVVSLDPIELEFNLAERDSARVQFGQRVRVTVAPYPGETFTGAVSVIAPTLEPQTRTLRVKARIANAEGRLRPGLFARAALGVALRRGLLWVPQEAVLTRARGRMVWVISAGDRVQQRAVQTGIHHNGNVEITHGLKAGEEVVVRGHNGLGEGVLIARRGRGGQNVGGADAAKLAGPPQ